MTAVTMREVLDSTPDDVAHVEMLAVEVARRVGFRGVSLASQANASPELPICVPIPYREPETAHARSLQIYREARNSTQQSLI